MTIQAAKFTPEVLLSAPRRSAGIPNPKGDKALYTVTTYSFESHRKTSQIRVLDIASGQSSLIYEESAYGEPTWVSASEFIFVKNGDRGSSTLMLGDISGRSPSVVKSFRGTLSNLKARQISEGTVAIACSALATPNGHMYSPDAAKPYSTAKVYSSLFVRHWDAYVDRENKSAVWYGSLKVKDRKWTLQGPGLVNALAGTRLESPVPPFGGSGDFDIGSSGIAFVAKDPSLSPALYTKTDLYYVPLENFEDENPPRPQLVKTGALQGYTLSPTFSKDGRRLAFSRMKSKQYESDKPRLLLIPDVTDLSSVQEYYETEDGEGGWDLRPEWIVWSNDDKELYVAAEQNARSVLFKLPSDPKKAVELPEAIVSEGSVSDARNLSTDDDRLFVSSTSLIDSSYYNIVDPASKKAELVSSSTKNGKSFGLSKSQLDEFWFTGAADYPVHALVVRPSDFDESKRYPLALLIHGGPQGAWLDSWSTRWNAAVFAEQGYVAVMPNITGSTSYGMAHENGIRHEWGGRPYNDLVNCFEHIGDKLPYVDTANAVALGASYGGFMINWIQGHPLGRKFKALVCHDGVFSTLNQFSSEELFFPLHDFGGTPWENREGYEKWDPAKHTGNWETPMLVIHNELDYRLPISEGLAMFNVLQSRGVPSRFLTFPDENHWVLKPENSLVWHKEVLGWINKYTGLDTSNLVDRTRELGI